MNETKKVVYVSGEFNQKSHETSPPSNGGSQRNGYLSESHQLNTGYQPSVAKTFPTEESYIGGGAKDGQKTRDEESDASDASDEEDDKTNVSSDETSDVVSSEDELSDSESVKTDDLLRLDPLYFRLTKFLQCSQENSSEKAQNITDVLSDIRNELRGLNLNFAKYLDQNQNK